jgi:hypothetical protein
MGSPRIHFFYALRVPEWRLAALRNRFISFAIRCALPFLKTIMLIFPKQTNCFAFCAEKLQFPQDLHPWLEWVNEQPMIRKKWTAAKYREPTEI